MSGLSAQIKKKSLPCGTWPSPVTVDLVAGKALALSEVSADGSAVYWLERRPSEKGRTVLCRWQEGQGVSDAIGESFDIGTRVHEYGGAPYAVRDGIIAFSEKRTDRLWVQLPDKAPVCLSDCEGVRYADLHFSHDAATVFAIREDHRVKGEAKAALVAFSVSDGPKPVVSSSAGVVLHEGPDFLSSPSVSPDGRSLAWIEWNHPAMPWDATHLCLADLEHDVVGHVTGLSRKKTLAGRDIIESLSEPCWTPDGRLCVISDRNGAWTLWEVDTESAQLKPCVVPEGEIGQPAWVFGQRSYHLLPGGNILALVVEEGSARCLLTDAAGKTVSFKASPDQCPVLLADGRYAWLEVAADSLPAVVVGTADSGAQEYLRCAARLTVLPEDISIAETIRFPVAPGGAPVGHAFFYPPANSQASVPPGELPPMIVLVHGGPTARAHEGFSFKIQWWTSRGFAVLDVNYGGSTGFGRSWRERLKGAWGVVDVSDCIAACDYVRATGRIDPARVSIRGSSAGGMTVLVALATSSLFAGGVSLYGVTDLRSLAAETHKFEARYLDGLIGPWPEAESVYLERSPLTVAEHIRAPVLLLQGEDDKVVPLSQAQDMESALKKVGTPCFLYKFPGEGHGFRQESTVRTALAAEMAFYSKIFNFTQPAVL